MNITQTSRQVKRAEVMMSYANISHAIAYMDVFMRYSDVDERPELGVIYQSIDTLSSQEVVSIIKDSVRRSNLFGYELILREMNTLDFLFHVQKKLNQWRYTRGESLSSNDGANESMSA